MIRVHGTCRTALFALLILAVALLAVPARAMIMVGKDGAFSGFIDFEVGTPPRDDDMPFDLPAVQVGDVFTAAFRAVLSVPPPDDGTPVPDGEHDVRFSQFDLTIGDTDWDAGQFGGGQAARS